MMKREAGAAVLVTGRSVYTIKISCGIFFTTKILCMLWFKFILGLMFF